MGLYDKSYPGYVPAKTLGFMGSQSIGLKKNYVIVLAENCQLTDWTPWSECSASCLPLAEQTRTRECKRGCSAPDCKNNELFESRPCSPLPCCEGNTGELLFIYLCNRTMYQLEELNTGIKHANTIKECS